MVWSFAGELEEVVAVARDHDELVIDRVLQRRGVGCRTWKHVAQTIDAMPKMLEQVAQVFRDVMIEESSRLARRHLPGDQDVDFTPMVLVIRQALEDLGAREVAKAVGDQAVDGFAVL